MHGLSIRKKIILAITALLCITNIVLIASGAYLSSVDNEVTLNDTLSRIEAGLVMKGLTLTRNNSRALQGLVDDYAFSAVGDLVSSTVRDDIDIIYGVFTDIEKRVWVYAVSNNEGTLQETDPPEIDFEDINDAYREITFKEFPVIEFISPVGFNGEVSGWIRYGISKVTLQILQQDANAKLKIQLHKFIGSLVFAGIMIALFGCWLAQRISAQLTRPITALARAASDVAAGDYTQSLQIETGCEIGELARNFEIMRETVKNKIEDLANANAIIEKQNRTLEFKVIERTSALSEKTKDMSNLLDNMPQGVFTIIEGNKIHSEYATFMHEVFKGLPIAEQDFGDVVFSDSTASREIVDSVYAAVESLIGEADIMYDFNSHLLVKNIERSVDGVPQYLALDWHPIFREQLIEKLMVVVRDVTEERELKARVEAQQQDLSIIAQIIQSGQRPFIGFINDARSKLAPYKSDECVGANVVDRFKMDLHSIKGSARTLGFSQITTWVHDAETELGECTKTLAEILAGLCAVIDLYETIALNKLKWSQKDENQASLESLVAAQLINIESVANTYEKPLPSLLLDIVHVELQPCVASALTTVLTHTLSNAVVHGIEPPEIRRQWNKCEQGQISIRARRIDERTLIITLKDDGKGLDLDRVWQVYMASQSVEQPRPSDQVISELVFISGFTTNSEISEVAGRGFGISAARQAILELGGAYTLTLLEKHQTGQAFEINIVVPIITPIAS